MLWCYHYSIVNIIRNLLTLIPAQTVYAHCDIPCGVYDVHGLQMAAHTVIRMTAMIGELKYEDNLESKRSFASQMSRLIHVKEKHGSIIEEELGTLDNDYFKPEHHKKFPELSGLLKSAVKLSIKVRQNIDMDASNELLAIVQKIAEIFYKTKDFEPVRIPSGYPTGGELVSHK